MSFQTFPPILEFPIELQVAVWKETILPKKASQNQLSTIRFLVNIKAGGVDQVYEITAGGDVLVCCTSTRQLRVSVDSYANEQTIARSLFELVDHKGGQEHAPEPGFYVLWPLKVS